MSGVHGRLRVVIVDARSPLGFPVHDLVESLAATHDVEVVADSGHAAEVVASTQPAAVLIHAGLEPYQGTPAAGPLVAGLCRHKRPGQPMALYTGNPSARLESALAQLGVTAPIVLDRRLLGAAGVIVRDLVEHASAIEALERHSVEATAGEATPTRIHAGFRVDQFLDEVDLALVRASVREYPDRTKAAWAVGMPVDTFVRQLRQHSLEVPRGRRPDSIRSQKLLWCSNRPAPPGIVDACDAADVSVREVPPGLLHPKTVLSIATTAALVEIVDPGSVFDSFLVHRSARPSLSFGSPAATVRLLLEALGLAAVQASAPDATLVSLLLQAGRCAWNLYQDDQLVMRLAFRRDGLAAWPIDRDELRHRLDQRVLRLARDTEGSNAAAAAAVGLEERTFRRRLAASRQVDTFDSRR